MKLLNNYVLYGDFILTCTVHVHMYHCSSLQIYLILSEFDSPDVTVMGNDKTEEENYDPEEEDLSDSEEEEDDEFLETAAV